jgi:hypothetical protein
VDIDSDFEDSLFPVSAALLLMGILGMFCPHVGHTFSIFAPHPPQKVAVAERLNPHSAQNLDMRAPRQ